MFCSLCGDSRPRPHLQHRQNRHRVFAMRAAHVRLRAEAGAEGGAFGAAEEAAAVGVVELHAGDAGGFARGKDLTPLGTRPFRRVPLSGTPRPATRRSSSTMPFSKALARPGRLSMPRRSASIV